MASTIKLYITILGKARIINYDGNKVCWKLKRTLQSQFTIIKLL